MWHVSFNSPNTAPVQPHLGPPCEHTWMQEEPGHGLEACSWE